MSEDIADRLPATLVAEGRDHPFTRAILLEIRARRDSALSAIEVSGTDGSADGKLRAFAGRAAAFREIIDLITRAKGRDDE